ncbi:MAG TPA: OB-fold domain-containing protein [Acidimicrobiales bacterium]|nr:OB-fold domain-containing protein [Acidimicrobiales bacterium]
MTGRRVLPLVDRDSGPYWEWLARGELRVQRCPQCGAIRWPARAFCNRCRTEGGDWEALSGRGRVVSWTVVEHATVGWYRDHAPYVVLTVALEEQEDCVVPGNLSSGVPGDLYQGMPVEAVFEPVSQDPPVTLLQWQPAGQRQEQE